MSDLWSVFANYWLAGGPVMYPLVVIGVVMQTLILDRMWALWGPPSKKFRQQVVGVLDAGAELTWQRAADEEARSGLRLLTALIAAAPLVGLLGTVSGMLVVFTSMAQQHTALGAGGMAAGISQAMITTQMGLILALPGMLAHRLLLRRAESLVARSAALAHHRRSTRVRMPIVREVSDASS